MIKDFLSKEAAKLLASVPHEFWLGAQLAAYVLATALGLWALAQVKTVLGWPGVAVVLAVGAYVFGWCVGWLHLPLFPLVIGVAR